MLSRRAILVFLITSISVYVYEGVGTALRVSAGEWEIAENFAPVTTGFSYLRRFGWWDDEHINGTFGSLRNDAPPAIVTPNAVVITGAESLPESFPSSLVSPIDGNQALYEVSYARPNPSLGIPGYTQSDAGDFDLDGLVDGRDFLTWQRGASPQAISSEDLYAWRGNYGYRDQWLHPDVVSPSRVELSLADTDAANFPDYDDVSLFDNPNPNVRGTALLEFDYLLSYLPPAPEVVLLPIPGFPPRPPKHPSHDRPYAVADATDVPVEIRFGLLYLDQDSIPANESCANFQNQNNCWNYVAASGNDFSVVEDSNDPFTQIIDVEDAQYFTLIADGQLHTAQIPMTFLTAAERLAEQWMDNQQSLPKNPENEFWNDPDLVSNLRWEIRGGTPHLLVIDNIRLSVQPAPANSSVPEPGGWLLISIGIVSVWYRR